MKQKIFVIFALLLLSFIVTQTTLARPELQEGGGVDILFVMDTSGSMSTSINTQNIAQTDVSAQLIDAQGRLDEFPGLTDPNNYRFEYIQLLLNWLQDFADEQATAGRNLDIYASVLAFREQTTTVLDWQRLSGESAPQITIPESTADGTGVNYIAAMEAVNAQLDSRPGDSTSRTPLVFTVSDSLPCVPSLQYSTSVGPANENCARLDRAGFHLNAVSPPPVDVDSTLFFAVPQSIEDLFVSAGTQTGVNAGTWQNIGTVDFAGADGIPGIMDEITTSILQTIASELNTQVADLIADNGGGSSITIPPYQASAELVILPVSPGSDDMGPSSYTIRAGNNADVTADAEELFNRSGAYQRLRFQNPPPGVWSITADNGAAVRILASYTPTSASVDISPRETTAFEPVTIRYQVAGITNAESANQDSPIAVTATVTDGTITEELDFVPSEDAWEATFLPLVEGGIYRVQSINVSPLGDWSNDVPGGTDFLNVEPPPSVTVTSFDITPSISVVTDDTLSSPRSVGGTVAMTQSQTLSVILTRSDNGVFDNRTSAVLTFNPVEDDTAAENTDSDADTESVCPLSGSEVFTQQQNENNEVVALVIEDQRFPQNGNCQLGVTVTFTDTRLLGVNGEQIIYAEPDFARLEVSETRELAFEIRDSDGAVITDQTINMEDRAFVLTDLPEFPYTARRIDIVMFDQNNAPIYPRFVPTADDVPDAEITSTEDDAAGADVDEAPPAPDDTDPVEDTEASEPIPFRLQVLNEDGEDIAPEAGIRINRSDNAGQYTAVLTNLDPGEYTVRVELIEPDGFTFDPVFAYAEGFDPTGDDTTPVFQVATIVVDSNPWTNIALIAMIAVGGIFAVYVPTRVYLSRRKRSTPPTGYLAIYERESAESEERQIVWTYNFESAKLNSFELPRGELPMWRPSVIYIKVDTERRKDGSASFIVRISDSENDSNETEAFKDVLLQDDEPRDFYVENATGRVYSIALTSSLPDEDNLL